jgi:hypothetical protein
MLSCAGWWDPDQRLAGKQFWQWCNFQRYCNLAFLPIDLFIQECGLVASDISPTGMQVLAVLMESLNSAPQQPAIAPGGYASS